MSNTFSFTVDYNARNLLYNCPTGALGLAFPYSIFADPWACLRQAHHALPSLPLVLFWPSDHLASVTGNFLAPLGAGIASKKSWGIFVGCPFSRLPRGFVFCFSLLFGLPCIRAPCGGPMVAACPRGAWGCCICTMLFSAVACCQAYDWCIFLYITRDLCDANMAAYGPAMDSARIRACA